MAGTDFCSIEVVEGVEIKFANPLSQSISFSQWPEWTHVFSRLNTCVYMNKEGSLFAHEPLSYGGEEGCEVENCSTPRSYSAAFDWFSFGMELCLDTASEPPPYWDSERKTFCGKWPLDEKLCVIGVAGVVGDGLTVVLENGLEFDNPLLPESGGTCSGAVAEQLASKHHLLETQQTSYGYHTQRDHPSNRRN